MSDKLKQNWRENWLLCINRLTSFDLQIKMWLDQAGNNPHWSYSEFMSCYIDDLDIIFLNSDIKLIVAKIVEIITHGSSNNIKFDFFDNLKNYDWENISKIIERELV